MHAALLALVLSCGAKTSAKRDAGPNRPPPPDPLLPLIEAAAEADPSALERAALRLHEEVVVSAMGDVRRGVRLAAVDAAPRGARPWATLGPLVDRLADRDRETASRAAAGVLAITAAIDPRAREADDVDPGTLAPITERATKVATDARLAPDVRVAAMQVVARLLDAVPSDVVPLLALADDPDPGIRHAALEIVRAWGPALRPHAAKLEPALRRDDDPRTALLAAAAICAAAPLPEAVAARARDLLSRGRYSDRQLLAPCLEPDRPPERPRPRRRPAPAPASADGKAPAAPVPRKAPPASARAKAPPP